MPLTASSFRQHVTSWTFRANDDFTLSPSMLNTFAAGYNRFNTPLGPPTDPQPWSSILGIPGIGTWAFPNITFGNGYQAIGSTNFFNYVNETELVKDGISWEHGTHSFKFGGEWRLNEHNSIVNGNSMGVFSFTSAYTANPSALSTTGDSFASFLLGGYNTVSSSGPLVYNVPMELRGHLCSGSVENHATPYSDLWVAVGVADATLGDSQQERRGQRCHDAEILAPEIYRAPLCLLEERTEARSAATDLSSIGPRVGFAWNALERTVFRGGYGIYYDKWTSGSNVFGIDSPGFQASYSNASQNSGLTPAGSLSAGLPDSFDQSKSLLYGAERSVGDLGRPVVMEDATGSELERRHPAAVYEQHDLRAKLCRHPWHSTERLSNVQRQSGRSQIPVSRPASNPEHQFSGSRRCRHSGSVRRVQRHCGPGTSALSAISNAHVVPCETGEEHLQRYLKLASVSASTMGCPST